MEWEFGSFRKNTIDIYKKKIIILKESHQYIKFGIPVKNIFCLKGAIH